MGPLPVAGHVVQKHLAGEQETNWDKTNKENYHFRSCKLLVCLVPVRFLLTSKVFLYHVTDHLQRTYYEFFFSFSSDKWILYDDVVMSVYINQVNLARKNINWEHKLSTECRVSPDIIISLFL